MNRVSIYQIPVTGDVLESAIAHGSVPASLVEPMQAMVAAIAHRAAEAPVRVYLCAEDDFAAARDGFAFVFAKALSVHVPSALLVDSDFLKVGLHGLVPQPDALGLLDFLLYGSSIGVVTQESPGGVRVVGAGSFPVTKRMPFVTPAFEEAARRLASHARCAVFVGPMVQEDGSPHPLAGEVDVTIVVRGETGASRGRGASGVDTFEEGVASGGVEVWSVRTGAAEAKPAPVRAPEPTPPPRPKAPPAPSVTPGPLPRVAVEPKRAPERTVETARALPTEPESRYSSLVPRIVVILLALSVIAFVSWWIWQDRSKGDDAGVANTAESTSAPVSEPVPAESLVVATEDATRAATTDTIPRPVPAPPVRPADTGGRTGGTVLVDPSDILVMDDLERRWKDWYAIHISSFQESIRAREEVSFLQSREFPVFIVFLDLGAKGKWYRVYAGPFETREEAREVKKNLDAVAQVRFTRITKIPE